MPTSNFKYSLPFAGFVKDNAHAPPLPTLKALKTWIKEACTKCDHNIHQEVLQKVQYCLNDPQLTLNFLISEIIFFFALSDGLYFLHAHQTCSE
jgi:hypothetical protein